MFSLVLVVSLSLFPFLFSSFFPFTTLWLPFPLRFFFLSPIFFSFLLFLYYSPSFFPPFFSFLLPLFHPFFLPFFFPFLSYGFFFSSSHFPPFPLSYFSLFFLDDFSFILALQSFILPFYPCTQSEQGKVIGLVSVYICVYKKNW